MSETNGIYTVADYLTLWIPSEAGAIHIKTQEPQGDPVELSETEASELIKLLTRLVAEIS